MSAVITQNSSSRKVLPKRVATFRKRALQSQFALLEEDVRDQLGSQAEAKTIARELLSHEIDFIANSDFSSAKAASEILGEVLLGTGLPEMKSRKTKLPDLPVHLLRLCEARLLTPDEEAALFQRMNFLRFLANQRKSRLNPETATLDEVVRVRALLAAADWHRDRLVQANMRLVISIVKKFVNAYNAFDDLLSDGAVALMRAVEKFDYGRGFRFSTYATQVVRRNAYRTVMEKQEERQKVNTSIDEAAVDVSDEIRQPSIDENKWHQMQAALTLLLDHLDRREKLIIRARFSLGAHRKVQTLQRLAEKLGVSKERIRQLEKRALEKLKDLADGFEFEPIPEPQDA